MINVRASFYDQGEGSGPRLAVCDKGRNVQERGFMIGCSAYFTFVLRHHFQLEDYFILCPGSIPERDGDKLYNTCTVFSPAGTMLGKYRKVSVDAKWVRDH